MVCGNKVDLRTQFEADGRRCVAFEDGHRLARVRSSCEYFELGAHTRTLWTLYSTRTAVQEHEALFVEASAKDNMNITEAVVQLARCAHCSLAPMTCAGVCEHLYEYCTVLYVVRREYVMSVRVLLRPLPQATARQGEPRAAAGHRAQRDGNAARRPQEGRPQVLHRQLTQQAIHAIATLFESPTRPLNRTNRTGPN